MGTGSKFSQAAAVLGHYAGYSINGMSSFRLPPDPLRDYVLDELHHLHRDAPFPQEHQDRVLAWYIDEQAVRGTEGSFLCLDYNADARELLLDGLVDLLEGNECPDGLRGRVALATAAICLDTLAEDERGAGAKIPSMGILARAHNASFGGPVTTFLRQACRGSWPAGSLEQRASLVRELEQLREQILAEVRREPPPQSALEKSPTTERIAGDVGEAEDPCPTPPPECESCDSKINAGGEAELADPDRPAPHASKGQMMSVPSESQSHLPAWFPDMLSATHLKFGPGVHFPGRMEEALLRATEECLTGLPQTVEDARICSSAFRGFTDLDSPWPGCGILAGVLKNIAVNPDLEPHRRDAALLGLTVLIVLEDRNSDMQRLRTDPHVQRKLANIRCTYRADGKTKELTGDGGCRPLLLEVLASGGKGLHPGVSSLAQDVLDGVKPGHDDPPFIQDHRDLVRGCKIKREEQDALIGGHCLLRAARLYSGGSMAGFEGTPITMWSRRNDPLEDAVGMIIAEILDNGLLPVELLMPLREHKGLRRSPPNAQSGPDEQRKIHRLALLLWIGTTVGADTLDAPVGVRLLAAGGGLAAILIAECSDLAPLQFLAAARSSDRASAALRSLIRKVEQRLLTADHEDGIRQIASEVWAISESMEVSGRECSEGGLGVRTREGGRSNQPPPEPVLASSGQRRAERICMDLDVGEDGELNGVWILGPDFDSLYAGCDESALPTRLLKVLITERAVAAERLSAILTQGAYTPSPEEIARAAYNLKKKLTKAAKDQPLVIKAIERALPLTRKGQPRRYLAEHLPLHRDLS